MFAKCLPCFFGVDSYEEDETLGQAECDAWMNRKSGLDHEYAITD